MNNNLASFITRRRQEHNLTKSQLARLCGINHGVISRLENGKLNGSNNVLWLLSKHLRCKYSELCELAGIPPTVPVVVVRWFNDNKYALDELRAMLQVQGYDTYGL